MRCVDRFLQAIDIVVLAFDGLADLGAQGRADDESYGSTCGRADDGAGTDADVLVLRGLLRSLARRRSQDGDCRDDCNGCVTHVVDLLFEPGPSGPLRSSLHFDMRYAVRHVRAHLPINCGELWTASRQLLRIAHN